MRSQLDRDVDDRRGNLASAPRRERTCTYSTDTPEDRRVSRCSLGAVAMMTQERVLHKRQEGENENDRMRIWMDRENLENEYLLR